MQIQFTDMGAPFVVLLCCLLGGALVSSRAKQFQQRLQAVSQDAALKLHVPEAIHAVPLKAIKDVAKREVIAWPTTPRPWPRSGEPRARTPSRPPMRRWRLESAPRAMRISSVDSRSEECSSLGRTLPRGRDTCTSNQAKAAQDPLAVSPAATQPPSDATQPP